MARGRKKENLTPEERLLAALVPESEQPYKIPGNWCWVKVGTVSKAKGGKRLPKGRTFLEEKSDYPYIRVTDFDNESICIENVKYIDSDTHMMIKNYTISSADIYISIAGTIGKVGIIPEELEGANLTENAAKITDINGAYQLYLMLFLKSEVAQNQMKDSTISTTQPKLALFRIEDILLPLPPLSEQQRIVDRIESLFAKLDEAKQKAQDALDSFETRKSAILHKAFTGELTAQWRKKHGVGMESWKKTALQNVCEKIVCGKTPTGFIHTTGEIPYLKVYNIVNNKIDFEAVPQFIPKEIHDGKLKSSVLKPNDVVMNIVGPPLRKIAIIPGDYPEWNMNQAIVRFRPLTPLQYQFLYYVLINPATLDDIISETKGVVGQANISLTQSRNLIIPLPSIEEQTEIVRILDDLLAKEQQAKEAAEKVLEQIDLIKKSILARAFRGELGTNDPSEQSAVELLRQVLSTSDR